MTAANDNWVWLNPRVLRAVHDEQLAEHGGPPGVRDEGMLASALGRPQHRASYGSPDVADLAASYAFGIARNHPFVDGNKRTAFVAAELFLDQNGFELVAPDEDCVFKTLQLAAGELDESSFAQWVRGNLKSRQD